MSDFLFYQLRQAEQREAMAGYNYASAKMHNAKVNARLAELKSQHQPLADLMDAKLSERDRLYAAAYYAVTGRFPDAVTVPKVKLGDT